MSRIIKVVLISLIALLLPAISINPASATCGTLSALYDPATYTSGTTLTDQSGCGQNGTIIAGTPVRTALPAKFTLNQAGATGQNFYDATSYSDPTVFSIAVWFRTSIAGGTKIMGFVQYTGTGETSYDRHLYIGKDGYLFYGVYDAATYTVHTSSTVTDGKWHLATAVQNGSTGRLYVDGLYVAQITSHTPQNYGGYWKIGGYQLTGWSDAASNALSTGDWVGDVGKTYIYGSTSITDTDVANLFNASKAAYIAPSAYITVGVGQGSATYRAATTIQETATIDGKANFYQNGKRIPGCSSVSTSSGGASCTWKPSIQGAATLSASVVPVDTSFSTVVAPAYRVLISRRLGAR